MTPHINCKKNEVAKIVLMPGDPLRAKWISETFLKDFKQINSVRNMLGYTGKYKNTKVTVMGHGMGMPSIGIYSYELFSPRFYDVDVIIRIGSAGAVSPKLKLNDIVIAKEAFSNSAYAFEINVKVKNNTLRPDSKLYEEAINLANKQSFPIYRGKIKSSDAFYSDSETFGEPIDLFKKNKILALEMEAFALYANAIKLKKRALCILTISDSLITNDKMSPEERQTGFKNMASYALELVKNISNKK